MGTRCSGAALVKVWGRRLDRGWIVVLLHVFSLEHCYFTVLLLYFSGGTGYLGSMMGTVQGSRERLKRMEEGLG
jgi:hypothetical protein